MQWVYSIYKVFIVFAKANIGGSLQLNNTHFGWSSLSLLFPMSTSGYSSQKRRYISIIEYLYVLLLYIFMRNRKLVLSSRGLATYIIPTVKLGYKFNRVCANCRRSQTRVFCGMHRIWFIPFRFLHLFFFVFEFRGERALRSGFRVGQSTFKWRVFLWCIAYSVFCSRCFIILRYI